MEKKTPGFFLQLRLLLWKNFITKRRNLVVSLVEVLLSLVLILILVLIRERQQAYQIPESHYSSKPLPSAGIIPVLQLFCDTQGDIYEQPNERLQDFLQKVQLITDNFDELQTVCSVPSNRSVKDFSVSDLLYGKQLTELLQQCGIEGGIFSILSKSSDLKDVDGMQDTAKLESSFETVERMKNMVEDTLKLVNDFHLMTVPEQNETVHVQSSVKGQGHTDKFGGLIELWKSLQPTLCGEKPDRKANKTRNDTDTGKKTEEKLTRQQMKYFSLIKKILYSNPKILYAPNNTVVQTLINKANESFMVYDSIAVYARQWLNISTEIRSSIKNSSSPSVVLMLLEAWLPPGRSLEKTLDVVDGLARTWLRLVQDINFDMFKGFKSEAELEGYFLNRQYWDNVTVIAGFVFENIADTDESLPAHVRYKIRQNATLTPPTNLARSQIWFPSPGSDNIKYYDFGFVWVQDMIERTIIDLQVGRDVSAPGNFVKRIPYHCWPWDGFVWDIQHIFPLCMMFSWVYTVSTLVQRIVYEKEKRLREVMKMMGLSGTVHWCAWFITAVLQMSVLVLIITLMLYYGKVLPYSDPGVVFVFLEVFAISSIAFSFLVSSFYSKSKLAAACAAIFYFLTYIPYIYISIREDLTGQQIPAAIKIATSLFSTTAFGLGGKYFLYYELEGVGVNWENIGVSPRENDDFSLLKILYLMIIDTVLYAILTWYIENIHPGTYGIARPWYFPVSKLYWCGQDSQFSICGIKALFGKSKELKYSAFKQIDSDPLILDTDLEGHFEEDSSDNPVGVRIHNLTKIYKKGNPAAVDDLNLILYENQITAFLGHNGAGKTTTMSILTGLFSPTSGTAYVYGHDIRVEMDKVRQNLGMCPQFNVLFGSLTVEEHLWFYARLKGMQLDDIREETDRMLKDLGLSTKRSTMPSCLSGGMQRKLSVAIAFVGGAKTVILDEPTAGVDPFSRRSIWKLLGQYKKGRTILLSTHHMDEADELGDRIAIISNGRLKCTGSSLYLKSLLGDGQHLHILKKSQDPAMMTVEDDNRGEEILETIKRIIPSTFIKFESDEELVLTVPIEPTEKHKLADVCQTLCIMKEQLGIKSFGVTDSGLEEIFVKITEETKVADEPKSEIKRKKKTIKKVSNDNSVHLNALADCSEHDIDRDNDTMVLMNHTADQRTNTHCAIKTSGQKKCHIHFTHFKALFMKRIHYTLRNRKGIFSQIILPAIFVSISMTIALSAPKENDPPQMVLSTEQYYHLMQPRGNYVPFHLEKFEGFDYGRDAPPAALMDSIKSLPTGLGGDCTMRSLGTQSSESTVLSFIKKRSDKPESVKNFYNKECEEMFSDRKDVKDGVSSAEGGNGGEIVEGLSYYPSCQCEKGSRFVCKNRNVLDPPEFSVVTGDHLQNISVLKEEDFYLYTTQKYRLHRYGGFSLGKNISYVPENFGQSMTYNKIMRRLVVKPVARVRFNQNGYHALPIYVNALNNAILRANLPKSKGDPATYGITVINHPMKKTSSLLNVDYIAGGTYILMAIFIIIAVSVVPASFVVFLVHERAIKAKHLQYMSGVHPVTYWLSNLVWDKFNYMIPMTCIIGILLAFRIPAYVGKGNIEAVTALFILYGWSMTPMMYPATFVFRESSVAYICLIILNLFTGVTSLVTTFILRVFDSDQNLATINHYLKKIFLVFPNFCLGDGLMDIALNQFENEFYFHVGQYDKMQSPLAWDLTGRKLVAMTITGTVFFIFTIFCDYGFFLRKRGGKASHLACDDEMDSDVRREKDKVLHGPRDDDLLRLVNLTKVYKTRKRGNLTAVNQLHFAVKKGECFGLLGVNGAGKTTTFKMLTGDIRPTYGDAILLDHSVLDNKYSVQQNIGYCPQFDALFDELTPREHLQLYARLHGVPSDQEKRVVNWALDKLRLVQYRNQTASTLSGGNKRKLSTAISLVGNPSLLYMDEPTAGMDPYSKKFLWQTIHDLVKDGKSVLFTSHSMEECEILCSRLSIMVNGQLKCLGSIQHLKDKFGEGYSLKMTLKSHELYRKVIAEVKTSLGECKLKERRTRLLVFEVQLDCSQLAETYSFLQRLVELNDIVEYSLSQNTLDNVFIKFAKQQNQSSRDIIEVENSEDIIDLEMRPSNLSSDFDEPLIELTSRNSDLESDLVEEL